ncbi:hypothetical protein ACZ90_40300 [Streptomyces albus subsp. albus]|nr:hypothetical protein ACZ90_40300 [Streptomyces albus subsp. albus]
MPATHVVCASGRVDAVSEALPGVTFDSLHPEPRGEAAEGVASDPEVAANAGIVLAASVSAAHATIAPRRPRVLIDFFM